MRAHTPCIWFNAVLILSPTEGYGDDLVEVREQEKTKGEKDVCRSIIRHLDIQLERRKNIGAIKE